MPAAKTVSLVCIGSFRGQPAFKGLGELTPGELAPLVETRRPVTEAQYAPAACGLDRWYGAVHLEGRGPIWRWDEQKARIGPI